MIQLLINGKEAVLPQKTSFKLLRCNSYFETQKGDYTFEVQLPLRGSRQNLDIFGTIHRTETSLKSLVGTKYTMELTAPPLHLTGYAQIRSINNESVKLQLVAGRSALQHGLADRPEYIDELNLGKAWDGFPTIEAYTSPDDVEKFYPGTSILEMKRIFHTMPSPVSSEQKDSFNKMAWGKYPDTDCVVFNTTAPNINDPGTELSINPWSHGIGPTDYKLKLYVYEDSVGTYWNRTILAPQPYLFDIIQRIIKSLGYQVGDLSYYLNSWMKNILIVNTKEDIARAHCLPHWTIGKFFTEIQRLLGAVWIVDMGAISLIPSHLYYSRNNITQLNDVVYTYTADFDNEADYEGTIGANVDYLWPTMDDRLKLPDEVFEKAKNISFTSEDEMNQYYADLDSEQMAASHELYEVNGDYYASLRMADESYQLMRLNQAGLMSNSSEHRDADIELSIVPCLIGLGGTMKATHLYYNPLYSIDLAINPQTESTEPDAESRDVMDIACNDGHELDRSADGKVLTIPTAVGFPWIINSENIPEIPPILLHDHSYVPKDGRFSLNPHAWGTIGEELYKNLKKVNSSVEKNFEFLDDISLDPTVPYLIDNKAYACHKLEITIDEDGVQPLKRGYFFELS